jgi:hypothetical protein
METKDLIKIWEQEKNSSERSNFDSLVDTAADWCNPPMNNIEKLQAKGQRKDSNRLIDIGIKACRMYTAGMMSNMFPQGQSWLKVRTTDPDLMEKQSVQLALTKSTKKFVSAIDESNFYEEITKSVNDTGWAGTTSAYVEADKKTKLNFRSHSYKEFYFRNDHRGQMNTYIREFKLTARQICGMFTGEEDSLPDNIVGAKDSGSDQEFTLIHIVMPRNEVDYGSTDKKKKPWASYYLCAEPQWLIRESGFDWMPYSVWGMYKGNNNEKYFRSPAMEVYSSLSSCNRMEVTRLRAAERVSSPPWLAPNDGSVRRISNDEGSIIYWNAGNPLSKPEQLVPSDNPMVNDEMIAKKEQEILDAFYVPLFNPLHDKRNMSATESVERLNLSMQFIVPAVNNFTKYGIRPLLETAFQIMRKAGYFPELEIPELSEAGIEFELTGKASLAARQLELYGTITALEQTGLMAQVKPEVMDMWDSDEYAKFVQDVNMVPTALRAKEDDVIAQRQQRAQMMQEERMRQNATAMGDAYGKTTSAPEEGSGAESLMQQFS